MKPESSHQHFDGNINDMFDVKLLCVQLNQIYTYSKYKNKSPFFYIKQIFLIWVS